MPLKFCIPTFLAILVCGTGALAEDLTKIPPPVPPLVAAVPENADWTVTVKNPPAEKGPKGKATHADGLITEVHSTKVGKLKRDLVTSGDGITREFWFVENLLIRPAAAGEVAVNDLGGAPAPDPTDPNPSVATGFPGMAWIGIEHYAGVVMFNDAKCYHYTNGDLEAWIDLKTKLPAGYKNGNTTYRFKFNAPPGGPLTMPPAYQKALDTVSEMRIRPS